MRGREARCYMPEERVYILFILGIYGTKSPRFKCTKYSSLFFGEEWVEFHQFWEDVRIKV